MPPAPNRGVAAKRQATSIKTVESGALGTSHAFSSRLATLPFHSSTRHGHPLATRGVAAVDWYVLYQRLVKKKRGLDPIIYLHQCLNARNFRPQRASSLSKGNEASDGFIGRENACKTHYPRPRSRNIGGCRVPLGFPGFPSAPFTLR